MARLCVSHKWMLRVIFRLTIPQGGKNSMEVISTFAGQSLARPPDLLHNRVTSRHLVILPLTRLECKPAEV